MIFRNLGFDSNLIMNPRVLILIYFYSSSREQTFLSTQLLAKFVSRPINPLTRIQSSRLSPPSLLVFPLHYFFFPLPLQRGYLADVSLPLSSFQLSLQGWMLCATIAHKRCTTYVTQDTDCNDDTQTISLMLRIHWSSLQCIIVSMMQRLRIRFIRVPRSYDVN